MQNQLCVNPSAHTEHPFFISGSEVKGNRYVKHPPKIARWGTADLNKKHIHSKTQCRFGDYFHPWINKHFAAPVIIFFIVGFSGGFFFFPQKMSKINLGGHVSLLFYCNLPWLTVPLSSCVWLRRHKKHCSRQPHGDAAPQMLNSWEPICPHILRPPTFPPSPTQQIVTRFPSPM